MPKPDYTAELADVLRQIREILDSTHEHATPAEKVVRIGWAIGTLPAPLREAVITEAQNRAGIGWAAGLKPTDWGK
jgi:hypothetical protein